MVIWCGLGVDYRVGRVHELILEGGVAGEECMSENHVGGVEEMEIDCLCRVCGPEAEWETWSSCVGGW